MSEEWKPKLPRKGRRCIICGEAVTGPPFEVVKPRKGPRMYMHTTCHEKEQRELKEAGQ